MKSLEKRIARLEKHIHRDEGDADAAAGPASYRLIVFHPRGDSAEQALSRWDLRRGELPEGIRLSLVACEMDTQKLPMLLGSLRPGSASKRQRRAYEQALTEALAQSPEERARRRLEGWERVREQLRRWKAREAKEPAG